MQKSRSKSMGSPSKINARPLSAHAVWHARIGGREQVFSSSEPYQTTYPKRRGCLVDKVKGLFPKNLTCGCGGLGVGDLSESGSPMTHLKSIQTQRVCFFVDCRRTTGGRTL